jgi:hypothetical protein
MQPLQDVLTESNGPRVAESDFFRRPPLRSIYFISGTFTMLVALAGACLLPARHWNESRTTAILFMAGAMVATVLLWIRAYQIFQRLHELYSEAKLDSSFVRSPIDKVFRSAGDLMFATLYFAFIAAFLFLLALASSFNHH